MRQPILPRWIASLASSIGTWRDETSDGLGFAAGRTPYTETDLGLSSDEFLTRSTFANARLTVFRSLQESSYLSERAREFSEIKPSKAEILFPSEQSDPAFTACFASVKPTVGIIVSHSQDSRVLPPLDFDRTIRHGVVPAFQLAFAAGWRQQDTPDKRLSQISISHRSAPQRDVQKGSVTPGRIQKSSEKEA